MRPESYWHQIAYLSTGTIRQQAAYSAIQSAQIMDHLAPYQPFLAGTIPLGIDLPESDLDILCEVHDPERFRTVLTETYGHLPTFSCHQKEVGGLPTVIARFEHAGLLFEIFGHPRPVPEQSGYRHMIVEARLLDLAGPEAAEAIRQLKADGLKTEPAFARYFRIPGDPYAALLDLYTASSEQLQRITVGR